MLVLTWTQYEGKLWWRGRARARRLAPAEYLPRPRTWPNRIASSGARLWTVHHEAEDGDNWKLAAGRGLPFHPPPMVEGLDSDR
jgi:hypothetical protein